MGKLTYEQAQARAESAALLRRQQRLHLAEMCRQALAADQVVLHSIHLESEDDVRADFTVTVNGQAYASRLPRGLDRIHAITALMGTLEQMLTGYFGQDTKILARGPDGQCFDAAQLLNDPEQLRRT